MNDQELMNCYLLLLKSSVEVYVHGTLESSNKDVRELLKFALSDILSAQARTYDEMVNYNWYKIENIKPAAVKKVYDKICSNN